jgi:hypothetical protein
MVCNRRHALRLLASGLLLGRLAHAAHPSATEGQRPAVMQPAFGSDGRVSEAFWSSLPLRTWIEVAGTRMDQLLRKLPPGFQDLGVEGFSAITADWSGAAFDSETGRIWCCGGGHLGSSNNGLYELDLERMSWRIAMQPSLYTPADLAASKAEWNQTDKKWIDFWQGYHVGEDWWRDGKPTALHTYGDIEFVPGVGVVRGGRLHYWHYDVAEGTATRTVPIAQWAPGIQAIYDREKKILVRCGNTAYEYWGIQRYDPFKRTALPIRYLQVTVVDKATGNSKPGPSSMFSWNGASATDIGNRKLFCYNGATNTAWKLDLDTLAGNEVVLENPFTNDKPAGRGQYVPKLKLCVALMRSGAIGFIDPLNGKCGILPASGTPPAPQPSITNGVFGRWRWYDKRGCLVLVPSTAENARLIRMV